MEEIQMPYISVVVPVYGSAGVLEELFARTVKALESITENFEFIFVNDSSPDSAWEVIKHLQLTDKRIRGLNLSRNFGQYPAITAGLAASRGEWVVVMDCDLQDSPEAIMDMYPKTQEGFYVVVGSRQERHDSRLRLLVSRFFYAFLTYATGRYHDHTLANFGLYHRKVVDALLSMKDQMRYLSVMVRWVGFRTTVVPVRHASRQGGRSGYSLSKLLRLAVDIILAYSDKPLRVILPCGVVLTTLAGSYLLFLLISDSMDTTMSLSLGFSPIALLILGVHITILGIIALYISKIFNEVKGRPIYIVQEEI